MNELRTTMPWPLLANVRVGVRVWVRVGPYDQRPGSRSTTQSFGHPTRPGRTRKQNSCPYKLDVADIGVISLDDPQRVAQSARVEVQA